MNHDTFFLYLAQRVPAPVICVHFPPKTLWSAAAKLPLSHRSAAVPREYRGVVRLKAAASRPRSKALSTDDELLLGCRRIGDLSRRLHALHGFAQIAFGIDQEIGAGDYLVTFYYADITVEHSGVHVGIGKATPVFQAINQAAAGGEVVHVTSTAPTIDPTSTTQGITIDKNYLKNIPVPGRTFELALGAAAGSQSDGLGVSFSGSSSLENQYYVDGVNTTGLTFGTVGSPVINDFIEEIEVITGGYNDSGA